MQHNKRQQHHTHHGQDEFLEFLALRRRHVQDLSRLRRVPGAIREDWWRRFRRFTPRKEAVRGEGRSKRDVTQKVGRVNTKGMLCEREPEKARAWERGTGINPPPKRTSCRRASGRITSQVEKNLPPSQQDRSCPGHNFNLVSEKPDHDKRKNEKLMRSKYCLYRRGLRGCSIASAVVTTPKTPPQSVPATRPNR